MFELLIAIPWGGVYILAFGSVVLTYRGPHARTKKKG